MNPLMVLRNKVIMFIKHISTTTVPSRRWILLAREAAQKETQRRDVIRYFTRF